MQVEAEEVSEVAEKCEVEAVPHFVMYKVKIYKTEY